MPGFLILLGTVVNNPIVVVDQTRKLLRDPAMSVPEAFRQAAASRLRPILVTTLTNVLGLSGLVCSTIVMLTFLPAALLEVLQWRERRRASAALGSASGLAS